MAAALVVAAAVAVPLLAFGGGKPTAVGLIRLDGHTGGIAQVERDASNRGNWQNMEAAGGTLWQYVSQKKQLLARDGRSGRVLYSFRIDIECGCQVALGFGSVWLLGNHVSKGVYGAYVRRVNETSGRVVERIELPGAADNGTIATGNGAVWVLEAGGLLIRIDPLTNHITRTYETHAVETNTLVPLAGFNWICECQVNKILRFDPRNGRSKTFSIPTQAYLVGVDASHTLWLLDPEHSTLTAVDPTTGDAASPLGLSGSPIQAVVAFGSMWVAAGDVVDRVDLKTSVATTIAMPNGVWAGSVAADLPSGAIWVGNSGKAPPRH